jgi:phospholipid/cholesterol/gamma-HCH transport system permease protein
VAGQTEQTLYRVVTNAGETVLALGGDWGRARRLPAAAAVSQRLTREPTERVVIDGAKLASAHPRVAAFIHVLTGELADHEITVTHRELPANVKALMALAMAEPETEPAPRRPARLARLGQRAVERIASFSAIATLIGQAAAKTPNLASGRAQTRWRDFIDLVRETGAASLPVVTIVNLLIGAVLGFIGAIQLRVFGAGYYLADLVGVAMARELAAFMTAFVMAGRIGATFAAHLATMEANEEIDALRMIGVSPFEFLALPRLAALTLMMPLLYLYATAVGMLGGLLVAKFVLGSPPIFFVERLESAVALHQFVIGFIKSFCFGALIALVSCHFGLSAERNAAAVGRAATKTVVVCIVCVIIIDALFAVATEVLGI